MSEQLERRKGMVELQLSLETIRGEISRLTSISEEMKSDIERINKTINGNGRAGLAIRIDRAEHFMEKDFVEHTKQDRWMFGLILSIQIAILVRLFF